MVMVSALPPPPPPYLKNRERLTLANLKAHRDELAVKQKWSLIEFTMVEQQQIQKESIAV